MLGAGRSSRAVASRIRRGSRLGDRPARSRHSDKEARGGPKLVANGEAQIAQRAFVGVEAQDLGAGRGALKREAGAQRPGARRVAAQESVEKGERGAGEEAGDRPALPFRSPAPTPGPAPAETGKLCWSKGLAAVLVAGAGRRGGCESALAQVGGEVWNEGESRRESPAHGESLAALCHLLRRRIRPACRRLRMSDKLALSDMSRNGPGRNAKARKFGPEGAGTAPEDAAERRSRGRRGVGQAPRPLPPALLLPATGLSGRLASSAETAKAYARSAQADNTQRAYAADWKMFASWLRRQGLPETPPDPEAVGLYLAAQVERRGAELSVATLERRLSGIAWRYRQLGEPLDIRDRHIATVLAGIRRRHGRPPLQKAAIFADELLAMLATLDMDLRGLRDRAILAIGFAGGLRRSEIVGLDCGPGSDRGRLRLGRNLPGGRPADHPRQDRLARGRNRPGLARRHLPGRPARDLAAARADRPRAPLPADRPQERRRFGASG